MLKAQRGQQVSAHAAGAREFDTRYPAGKPATDAAREFARKWIAALQAQGVK